MSQHRPSIDDLLATVRDLLDATAPQLAGEARYKLQVASYLVGICERELTVGRPHPDEDRAAWSLLLKRPDGEPGRLAADLCASIRRGELDAEFDATVEAVLSRTTAAVRVVRPTHLDRDG